MENPMFRYPIHLALIAILGFSAGFAADPAPTTTTPAPAPTTTTPAVTRLATDQWCWTHDLPKDKCAACDKKLIPALKKANDWCPEHACAESTCVKCDPKAKDRLDALRPTEKPPATK